MKLFDQLCIETQSDCNRACATCLRQTRPEKRNGKAQMPTEMVLSVMDQALDLGFNGRLCLQHFNEPLLDKRLVGFARHAKGQFSEVMVNTNGDYLSASLDGAFDRLHVALYGQHKEERRHRIESLLPNTRLTFTDGQHYITHYSPFTNTQEAIDGCRPQPCRREVRMRMIVGYTGEMLLCCEDIAGEWGLGNVGTQTLEELWFGDRHREIIETLSRAGGRDRYPYCAICPRPDRPYSWKM